VFIANGISEQQRGADVIRTRVYEVLITNRHTRITQAVSNNTLLESPCIYTCIFEYNKLPPSSGEHTNTNKCTHTHTHTLTIIHEYVTIVRDANLKIKENLRLITVYVCSTPETIFPRVAILALYTHNTVVYILFYLNIYLYGYRGHCAGTHARARTHYECTQWRQQVFKHSFRGQNTLWV